jgi:hypothetical protein
MQWAAGRAYLRGGCRNARDLVVLAIPAPVRPLDETGRDPSLKPRLHVLGSRHIRLPIDAAAINYTALCGKMLQAIGAQATYPDRQVISMSGDGGFSMMMGDFITLTQMGFPVKVIVLPLTAGR